MPRSWLTAAIGALEEAVGGAPGRGDIRLELAMAYAKAGNYRSAWEQVHQAQANGAKPREDFISALRAQAPEPKP